MIAQRERALTGLAHEAALVAAIALRAQAFLPELEAIAHDRERELAPRDLLGSEQLDLEALGARCVALLDQLGAIQDVRLPDVRDIEVRVRCGHAHARAGFFPGLAHRAFDRALAELEEARGQRPPAAAR